MKDKKLRAARVKACRVEFPYFSRILHSLTFIEKDDCPTLSVDQYLRVYYNREFIESLTLDHTIGVIVHEALHPFLLHHERAKRIGADPHMWNIAADMEINDGHKLRTMLPDFAVFPWDNEYKILPEGMTAEWYLNKLLEDNDEDDGDEEGDEESVEEGEEENQMGGSPGAPTDEDGEGDSEGDSEGEGEGKPGKGKPGKGKPTAGNCGSGADGQKRDWEDPPPSDDSSPGVSKSELNRLRRQTAKDVMSSSKARGEVGAGILRAFADILEPPKLNWKQLLQKWLRESIIWCRGNQRYSYRSVSLKQAGAPKGVVLPGRISPIPNIGILVDTSGSMSGAILDAAGSEIHGILKSTTRAPATVLSCDAEVNSMQKVRRISDIELGGGGGTDMRVGIKAVQSMKNSPNILLVLTDGYTPWPKSPVSGMRVVQVLVGPFVRDDSPAWMDSIRVED